MDLARVISALRSERAHVASAIETLEQLSFAKRRGPGRPPKSLTRRKEKQDPETTAASLSSATASLGR